jgi:hypothetical protein
METPVPSLSNQEKELHKEGDKFVSAFLNMIKWSRAGLSLKR